MHYFSAADHPRKGIGTVLVLIQKALRCYPADDKRTRPIYDALENLSLTADFTALPHTPFPSDLRSYPASCAFAARAWADCDASLASLSRGDAEGAWRAIASAALSAGSALARAVEDKSRRQSQSKGGRGKTAPAWHAAALEHAAKLREAGKNPRDIPALVATKQAKSTSQVRRVLAQKKARMN